MDTVSSSELHQPELGTERKSPEEQRCDDEGKTNEVLNNIETLVESEIGGTFNVADDNTKEENFTMSNDKLGDMATASPAERPTSVQLDVDSAAVMSNKLRTISQYMTLVENRKNHATLLRDDTMTGFLVLSLGDTAPEVVESSFQVVRALSKYEDNLLLLKNSLYVIDALRCATRNSFVNETVRIDAKNLIASLKSVSLKNHPPLAELSESVRNVMVSTSSKSTHTNETNKNPADLNTTMSTMKRKNKGRETILYVENGVVQQKAERTRVTQVLIGVPGIISVTYDIKKDYCIVRGKRQVPSEEFGRAVASLELANVYLIRKNENKEEVKTLITANEQENMAYPSYPEEQENEEADSSTAVAKKDQLPGDDSSFFKSAKNFIKRSFYW